MRSRSLRRSMVGGALCAALIGVGGGTALHAHEIGTTRVSVLIRDGRSYDVEIVTDAAALVEKLEAMSGEDRRVDPRAAALQSQLTAFDEQFRRRVTIAFDQTNAAPAIAYTVAPAADVTSASVATIRLTGSIPEGAREFSWTYGWTFASYAMTVRHAATDNPATEWLEGGQRSAPIALHASAPALDRLTTLRRY